MLCSTYSLLALSSEQQNARHMLARLEHFVLKNWDKVARLDDCAFLEATAQTLGRFHHYCRTRKLEVHVLPAIRKATRVADALIDELELLGAAAANMFGLVEEQFKSALDRGARLHELRFSIEIYCQSMVKKLLVEEGQLFPIMRGLLPAEEWFAMASKFLASAKTGSLEASEPGVQLPLANRRKLPAKLGLLADHSARSKRQVWSYGMAASVQLDGNQEKTTKH